MILDRIYFYLLTLVSRLTPGLNICSALRALQMKNLKGLYLTCRLKNLRTTHCDSYADSYFLVFSLWLITITLLILPRAFVSLIKKQWSDVSLESSLRIIISKLVVVLCEYWDLKLGYHPSILPTELI